MTEQKAGSQNDENVLNFRWKDVQGEDEEHIAKATDWELTKVSWWGVFLSNK